MNPSAVWKGGDKDTVGKIQKSLKKKRYPVSSRDAGSSAKRKGLRLPALVIPFLLHVMFSAAVSLSCLSDFNKAILNIVNIASDDISKYLMSTSNRWDEYRQGRNTLPLTSPKPSRWKL